MNIVGYKRKNVNDYEEFILNPFPFEFENIIDDNLKEKIFKAQHLVSRLSGITELLPDVDFFIQAYILKDATSSSQIEGTMATMNDALESKITGVEIKDSNDIHFYIRAVNFGLKKMNNPLPLSLRFIGDLHKELMLGARSTHFSDPGEFRKSQNWIGGTTLKNAKFVPPSHENMNDALKDLELFLHLKNINPIIQLALAHAQFETIHPFLDGNGRTGRLLITFLLLDKNILEKPTLFLSSYFKEHQTLYYDKLNGYHNGEVYEWLEFFADAVIDTAEEAIRITKKITDLRNQDMAKVQSFGRANADKAVKTLQKLFANPVITKNEMIDWFGYTSKGGLQMLERLVEVGILELYRKGEGRSPSVYVYKKYVKIFSS